MSSSGTCKRSEQYTALTNSTTSKLPAAECYEYKNRTRIGRETYLRIHARNRAYSWSRLHPTQNKQVGASFVVHPLSTQTSSRSSGSPGQLPLETLIAVVNHLFHQLKSSLLLGSFDGVISVCLDEELLVLFRKLGAMADLATDVDSFDGRYEEND